VQVLDLKHCVGLNISSVRSPNLDDPHHAITRIDVKKVFKGIVSIGAEDTERLPLHVGVIRQLVLNPVRGIRNSLFIRGSDPDARLLVLRWLVHNDRVSHP
jgi:hypothetical protein